MYIYTHTQNRVHECAMEYELHVYWIFTLEPILSLNLGSTVYSVGKKWVYGCEYAKHRIYSYTVTY